MKEIIMVTDVADGRMRGRVPAGRLSHPRLRLLENRVARRRHQPGAGAAGRADELGSEDDAEVAKAR